MNNVEDATLRVQYNDKQKQSRAMTDAEKAILAAELAKPEYAGLSASEKLDRLNLPRTIPNPAPKYVDRPQMTIGDLQALLMKAKTPGGADLIDTIATVATGEYPALAALPAETKAKIMYGAKLFGRIYNSQMACLDLEGETGAEVKDGIAAFVAIGVMGNELADSITKMKVANRPDTVEAAPLAVELFGPGAFVEAADIEGL